MTTISVSIYGWNVVYLFKFVSILFDNVVHNALRNVCSLSEMNLLGIPKCTQNSPNKQLITSFPLMVFLHSIRTRMFLNISTTKNRWSCPFLFVGKPLTKPREIKKGGYKKGMIWIISRYQACRTTNHASSYEPSYLLLHLGPIHISMQVGNYLLYTKIPYNLGGVSLYDQLHSLTFMNT